MKTDIITILKIFREEIYNSPIALQNSISKIEDKQLQLGLIVDLISRKKEYEIENLDFGDITNDFDMDKGFDAHDYYINKLNQCSLLNFQELVFQELEVTENQNLIDFIKSVSKEDIEEITQYCIDEEAYELITFINSLRN